MSDIAGTGGTAGESAVAGPAVAGPAGDDGVVGAVVGAVESAVSDVVGGVLKAVDAQNLADRLWNRVLRANRGGHHRAGAFTTDFEAVPTLAGLRAMIETTDPAAVQAVADHWRHLHDELQDTAAQLTTHADNLLEHWNGPSAAAFRRQVQTLRTSLTNGAAHAANAAAATGGVAHALTVARTEMPPDPSLLDTVLRAVTSQTTDWKFKADAAKHGLAHALAADGAQLSAQEQARQQAVVVMERLGVAYNNATAQLDHPPTRTAATHARRVWPPEPVTAHASLLGQGPLRAGPAGIGSGALVGGGIPAAAPASGSPVWLGAPPPEVSPTAVTGVSEPSRAGGVAEAEPAAALGGPLGEGMRPSAGSGSGGSGRRNRTRYPLPADGDDWDAPPSANPPVIEA
ncbi:PPE domain-containing protein [Streptacidiphilus jiangxiensis]|uniref:PPE family protein n=1 Tax=Streptacidiphilus jiangxiensis TaxID=235985 RepID=A0A1H7MUW3_STRJI|nr:PPE domain-containing protein [Streptacidiphilus jiangxiensis]SEL14475.1 PPE family protein [Streptacidiphilus jiangxiensis]